jgi:8-oxo-dGTP pyrophosphatase MutT (NUDIX family)
MATTILHPEEQQLLNILRQKIGKGELPGPAAQHTMAPPVRGGYAEPPADARRASVLALLYPIAGHLHLLYIQRTSPKRDRHAGQISFPGGSVEVADTDAVATALRETEEEVGIPREEIEILGTLTQLYIPISNFLVDPIVGFLPQRPSFVLQESEVARTLELPLSDFLTTTARQVGTRKLVNGMSLPDVPFWAIGGEEVWGATSMMTAELIALLP